MTDDPMRRVRWWTDRPEPPDAEELEDPWPVGEQELGLDEDQVRFLRALVDQPRRLRIADSLPGLGGEPGPDPRVPPGPETGD